MTRDELEAKLLAGSEVDGDCRRWTGAHTQKGYGHIFVGGKARRVHRVAHEVWIGPVPAGHDIDHVHARGCRHRDCIEPAHLEAVTHAENVRRAAELITHCPKDHEYTPENLLATGSGRRCRTCFNAARKAARVPVARRAARCGTYGGYTHHLEQGTPTCQPCRDAKAAYNRAYMAARRQRAQSAMEGQAA